MIGERQVKRSKKTKTGQCRKSRKKLKVISNKESKIKRRTEDRITRKLKQTGGKKK